MQYLSMAALVSTYSWLKGSIFILFMGVTRGSITNATCPMISQPELQILCIKSGASDLTNLAIQHWQVVVGGSFIYSVQ